MAKEAIVLLSGGIDSTTTLAIAQDLGYDVYAMTFDYDQRHRHEIRAAECIAGMYCVKQHLIINMDDMTKIGGSALTSIHIGVPTARSMEEIGEGIPLTYVPARNTIFLSYALAWADVLEIDTIFIGVNALDYSGYPDCRPEYITAYENMANLATKSGVQGKTKIRIKTPLIAMTKAQIIKRGMEIGVNYGLTISCYRPSTHSGQVFHCGICDSCILRKKGFSEAGVTDPTEYR